MLGLHLIHLLPASAVTLCHALFTTLMFSTLNTLVELILTSLVSLLCFRAALPFV